MGIRWPGPAPISTDGASGTSLQWALGSYYAKYATHIKLFYQEKNCNY